MKEIEIDRTKPLAVMIYDKDDTFGIACDRKGGLLVRQSIDDFISERRDMNAEYTGRGGSWGASVAMFRMQFTFHAIHLNNFNELETLVGPGPYTIKTISSVAGTMHVMCVPSGPFKEKLKASVTIS